MNNPTHLHIASLIIALGFVVMTPAVVLADGYTPLNLPDRGDGPTGVQGESTSSATPTVSPSATATPGESTEDIASGTVQRVEDGQLILDVDGDEQAVDLPKDVRVTRDGQDAQLDDIQTGDTVSFERNDEGNITEVRVASEQSMNFWRGFLPILVVILVGFYLLSRRTKRSV